MDTTNRPAIRLPGKRRGCARLGAFAKIARVLATSQSTGHLAQSKRWLGALDWTTSVAAHAAEDACGRISATSFRIPRRQADVSQSHGPLPVSPTVPAWRCQRSAGQQLEKAEGRSEQLADSSHGHGRTRRHMARSPSQR